jgi:cytoskeleton protein RodZ
MIVIVARDETWVTVTEAGGKHLLNRTVKAGETIGLSGNLPLSVVVGRASGVDVQVRGKPFDLTPLARSGGVARFEVKS